MYRGINLANAIDGNGRNFSGVVLTSLDGEGELEIVTGENVCYVIQLLPAKLHKKIINSF